MRFEIAHQPSTAISTAHVDLAEKIQTDGGAMISMDSGISIETKPKSRNQGAFLSRLMPRLPDSNTSSA